MVVTNVAHVETMWYSGVIDNERGHMPNHITTKIIGPPSIINLITRPATEEETKNHNKREKWMKEFYDDYQPEPAPKDVVDFNEIIPQPGNIETGGCNGTHLPSEICWYRWNVDNWGTKWNAYSARIERISDETASIRFQTAWSHPFPIIKELSRQIKDVELSVSYASEDLGSNCGTYTIVNGERTDTTPFIEHTSDAEDFADRLINN